MYIYKAKHIQQYKLVTSDANVLHSNINTNYAIKTL